MAPVLILVIRLLRRAIPGKTQLQEVGGGSGFIISSDGLILTNKHVVSDINAQYSVLTNDGNTYTAKVLARDPNQDLAVLKIDATNLPTVTLGNSDTLQLGQTAIAIGNALGQFSKPFPSASFPASAARSPRARRTRARKKRSPVSSRRTPRSTRQFRRAAARSARRCDRHRYCRRLRRAKYRLCHSHRSGKVRDRIGGIHGADPSAISWRTLRGRDARDRRSQKLPITYGALVDGGEQGAAVMANSPAAEAGIQSGDIIESVNGLKLDSTHDLGERHQRI